MKHYLSYIDESIKTNWNRPALSNYGANTLAYGVVASEIEKVQVIYITIYIDRRLIVRLFRCEAGVSFVFMLIHSFV